MDKTKHDVLIKNVQKFRMINIINITFVDSVYLYEVKNCLRTKIILF